MVEQIAEEILSGIEASIQVTEKRIYQLKIEFASLLLNGASAERLTVLRQLYILQTNLKLLKVRRMYASEKGR